MNGNPRSFLSTPLVCRLRYEAVGDCPCVYWRLSVCLQLQMVTGRDVDKNTVDTVLYVLQSVTILTVSVYLTETQ